LDVLGLFGNGEVKNDRALECLVSPVDVPVNMLMSRVNLVYVTVSRVVNFGVVRDIGRDVS